MTFSELKLTSNYHVLYEAASLTWCTLIQVAVRKASIRVRNRGLVLYKPQLSFQIISDDLRSVCGGGGEEGLLFSSVFT